MAELVLMHVVPKQYSTRFEKILGPLKATTRVGIILPSWNIEGDGKPLLR